MSWWGGRSRRSRRRDTGRPPSEKAVERLATSVEREVDALREEFSDDLLLTMLLLDAGEVDEAQRLVDSQTDRLRRFEQHVDEAVASAAVEREAEGVVAAAGSRDEDRRLPALATGVLTATAGFLAVLAILAGPADDPDHVASESLERLRTDPRHSVHEPGASAREQRAPATAAQPEGPRDGMAAGDEPGSGFDVLRLIGGPGRLLADLADDGESPLDVLLNVGELIRKLEPEIEQIRARQDAPEGEAEPEEQSPQEEPSGDEAGAEEEPPAVGGEEPAPPTEPDDSESGSESEGSEQPSEDEDSEGEPTDVLNLAT